MILLGLAALASFFGLYLLIFAAAKIGRASSPYAVAQITYPRTWILLDLAIFIKCIGVCVSYLLVMGSVMSSFSKGCIGVVDDLDSYVITSERFWVSVFVVIIAPLSFLKKVDSLKYSSFLGLVAFVYIACLSVVHLCRFGLAPVESIVPMAAFDFKRLGRFGVFVFAFTCHQNIFPLYNETKRNSVKNMTIISASCVLFSFGLYATYGLCSYLSYADVVMNHKNMFEICKWPNPMFVGPLWLFIRSV